MGENESNSVPQSSSEHPKSVFKQLPRPARPDVSGRESPKEVFRYVTRRWLNEERPDEIAALCQHILLGTRERAAKMVAPLVRLDHDRLDPRIREMIENTLYYAMTGERRAALER